MIVEEIVHLGGFEAFEAKFKDTLATDLFHKTRDSLAAIRAARKAAERTATEEEKSPKGTRKHCSSGASTSSRRDWCRMSWPVVNE